MSRFKTSGEGLARLESSPGRNPIVCSAWLADLADESDLRVDIHRRGTVEHDREIERRAALLLQLRGVLGVKYEERNGRTTIAPKTVTAQRRYVLNCPV